MIDLPEYLHRIGLTTGPLPPTAATLQAVHAAHARRIPFENLDIHLGRPISTDIDVIFDKLVRRRRGGYCFEQNVLLAAVLAALGFETRLVLGRVTFGARTPRPRGHLAVRVEVAGQPWLADVGFGGYGLIEPLRLVEGEEQAVGGETYRIDPGAAGGREVLMRAAEGWKSLYWFDDAPCYPVDIAVLNFYHLHCPESVFHQNRIVALAELGRRRLLTNEEFKIIGPGGTQTYRLADEAEYRQVLATEFGIELTAAEQLRPRLVLAE